VLPPCRKGVAGQIAPPGACLPHQLHGNQTVLRSDAVLRLNNNNNNNGDREYVGWAGVQTSMRVFTMIATKAFTISDNMSVHMDGARTHGQHMSHQAIQTVITHKIKRSSTHCAWEYASTGTQLTIATPLQAPCSREKARGKTRLLLRKPGRHIITQRSNKHQTCTVYEKSYSKY
jgi:hypothetical protein